MSEETKNSIRAFIREAIQKSGDPGTFDDHISLFSSGRLDSLTMMNLVMFLESNFSIDFSKFEFDVDLVDSIHAIDQLLDLSSSTKS